MGFRGIKNRIFIQFWILFFLSMLLIDVLVVFIFLERTISGYVDQKKFSLTVACENHRRFFTGGQQSALLKESPHFPAGDRFFFCRQNRDAQNQEPSGPSIQRS
jgi:hypothetical protein